MEIVVRRKHIKMGQPKRGRCPLSLACQEAFDLDEKCVQVSPKVLTMINYRGSIVYSVKWPPIAEKFYEDYFNHFKLGHKFAKMPKPITFDIGLYEYYPGYVADILHRVVFDIHNWNGDLEYEEP